MQRYAEDERVATLHRNTPRPVSARVECTSLTSATLTGKILSSLLSTQRGGETRFLEAAQVAGAAEFVHEAFDLGAALAREGPGVMGA